MIPATITRGEYIEAVGWISAELAHRAGAWEGNAPSWFPEPPEWLALAERAMDDVSPIKARSDRAKPKVQTARL
jgi:hypothetical protein